MDIELDTKSELRRVESQYSSHGLFRRYAGGRIKGFVQRQIMTFTGAMALAFYIGFEWGLIAACIALFGESVDIVYLRRWRRMSEESAAIREILRKSTLTAAFQAITISICVAIAWFASDQGDTTFFCLAYLTGAAMNAGLTINYHWSAAIVRLCIYGFLCAFLFLANFALVGHMTSQNMLELFGTVMMAYMIKVFIDHNIKHFKRERQNARDLLRRQRIIEYRGEEIRKRETEARMLSMVATHATDAILLLDPDRKITWVNDAFTRITGFSSDEVIGAEHKLLLERGDENTQEIERLSTCLSAGTTFRGELQSQCKGGRRIWIDATWVPVKSDDGDVEIIVAVERDITLAKQHERDMAAARVAAERGEKAKAEFLAVMSHEIRTPLNGIMGMADLLVDTTLNEDQLLYATTVKSSATALLRIINDILDLSKLDAGKLSLDPIDFQLGPCILEAVTVLRPRAEENNLYLEVSFDTELPKEVNGDDGRLRQILLNLIGNAVKFTEKGGVLVSVRHEETEAGLRIYVDIQDTGVGIPKNKIEGIFDQFSQVDAATTRNFGGTGLGLTISRLLAQQMGGDIEVTSKAGIGSTFSVSLVFDEAVGTETQQDAVWMDIEQLRGARVLLAEDNAVNRILVERYLKDIPIDLLTVENGLQAIDATKDGAFDIVLMDMSMPEMDGIEATQAIRDINVAQPEIVALTANAFASDRQRCLEAGMDDFLSKPIKKGDLIRALLAAIERRAQQDDFISGLPSRVGSAS